MKEAAIISQKFNLGHLSGLMGWYSMLETLGYKTTLYLDRQYDGFIGEGRNISFDINKIQHPDVAVIFNLSTQDAKIIHYLKKKTSAKILFIHHEPWKGWKQESHARSYDIKSMIKPVAKKLFALPVLKNCDVVICPSKQAADTYAQNEAKYNSRYIEFPLVFLDECPGGNYEQDKKYFSFIATASMDKAIDKYFEFVKYASQKDKKIVFQVVTSSDITKFLSDKEIQQLISNKRLSITQGRGLTELEMNQAYNNSRCTWLAYRISTQSGVIPKAFMWGSPCVASNVGAFREVVDGTNSILVPSCDSLDEILEAYHKIMHDEQRFQTAARTTFEKLYSANSRVPELAAILDSL